VRVLPATAVFASRDFGLYLAARFLSALAIQMQNVAIGWLVYDLTRDPFALGLVGVASFLPAVALALVTGHTADRYDRRGILVLCYLVTLITGLGLLGLLGIAVSGSGQTSLVYGLLLVFGISRAFANPAGQALLPIYARDILDAGTGGLGLMRSMPAVGALLVALWLAQRPLQSRSGLRMFQGVALFGIATIGFGLSTSLILSCVCLFVLGAADMISVFVRSTLVQFDTPDAMRGRVAAVNSVFIGASNELGEFEWGANAAAIGTVPSVVVGGVGTLAVCGVWMRWFPELRYRDRLTN